MFCAKCGTNNADGVRYCRNCGNDLGAPAAAPTQQYYNPYGNTAPAGNPGAAVDPGKGFAVAALVCGIISFFLFAFICGPLGIIFGGVAKSKGSTSPMATAGIVCGAIGFGLYLILLVAAEATLGLFF